MSEESTAKMQQELPDVGTKVVQHREFEEPLIGEIVPPESWEQPDEITADSFVVDFGDHRSRYTLDEAPATQKVVHIHIEADRNPQSSS